MSITIDDIDKAFEKNFDKAWNLFVFEMAGFQLRDASLEEVEHYFVYNADAHADLFLGGPGPDGGIRKAA